MSGAFASAWSLLKAPYRVKFKDEPTREYLDLSRFGDVVYSGGSISDPETPYFIDREGKALDYAVFGSAIPRTAYDGKPFRMLPMRETVPRLRRLDLRNVPFNEEPLLANPTFLHNEIQIPKEWEQFVEEVPYREVNEMIGRKLEDWDYEGVEEDMEDVFIDNDSVFGNTSANFHSFMEALQHMKDARKRLGNMREGNLTIPKGDAYYHHFGLTDKLSDINPHHLRALYLMEAAKQGMPTSDWITALYSAKGIDPETKRRGE